MNKLKSDLNRYIGLSNRGKLRSSLELIFVQGVWAIVVYRFGQWCGNLKVPLISQLLKIVYFFLFKIIEVLTGISISSNAKIGSGIYIGHFGGIFIHSDAIIGKNFNIAQGVTVGVLGLGKKGAPIIGDNVFIGSGAKVLGSIKIGNNVKIGANAVVVNDVPANCTVVGIPARVIKIKEKDIQ